MIFHLNNFSAGWNERLMEVLVRARSGDRIVVPTKEIQHEARLFAWAASVVADVQVLTLEEYKQQRSEGEYGQKDTFQIT